MNWLPIFANAGLTASAPTPVRVATVPVARRLVIINQDTRPARPAVPSLSSAIPTATPIANSQDMLSIRAPPAFTRKNPMI